PDLLSGRGTRPHRSRRNDGWRTLGARSASMVKIVVTRALPEIALERLRALGDVWVSSYPRPLTMQELHETAAGASALVTMPMDRIDAPLLAAAGPDLKIVANFAVGFDNIDVE